MSIPETAREHLTEVLDPALRHLLAPEDWCDVCECPRDVVDTSLEEVRPADREVDPFTAAGTYTVYTLSCGHVVTCPLADDPSALLGEEPDPEDLFGPLDPPDEGPFGINAENLR